jgi:hypothetical protein
MYRIPLGCFRLRFDGNATWPKDTRNVEIIDVERTEKDCMPVLLQMGDQQREVTVKRSAREPEIRELIEKTYGLAGDTYMVRYGGKADVALREYGRITVADLKEPRQNIGPMKITLQRHSDRQTLTAEPGWTEEKLSGEISQRWPELRDYTLKYGEKIAGAEGKRTECHGAGGQAGNARGRAISNRGAQRSAPGGVVRHTPNSQRKGEHDEDQKDHHEGGATRDGGADVETEEGTVQIHARRR